MVLLCNFSTALGAVTCLGIFGWHRVLEFLVSVADQARNRSHILNDLLFFGLILVVGLLAFPGMSMIELACGFVLGFTEAFIVSLTALVVVSFIAFGIGRYYLRGTIRNYLEDSEMHSLKLFLKSVERRSGVVLLTLFRLMFIPLFAKNYGPSVIETRFRDYAIAVLLTTPLYVAMLTFIGSRAKTIAELATGTAAGDSSAIGWMEIVPIVVSVLAGVIFTWLAYIEFKKLSAADADEAEAPLIAGETPVESVA